MKAASNLLKSVLHKKRYGLSFDGTNRYVTATPGISGAARTSMELWAKLSSLSAFQVLMCIGPNGGLGSRRIDVNTSGAVLVRYGAGDADVGPAGTVKIGTPVHLCSTFDGTTKRLYLNGAEIANSATSATDVASNACIIGASQPSAEMVSGLLDEVRLYKRALSAAEVAAHYAGSFANESGLVGYWGMDDGAGSQATDLSGYASHGTLVNTPAWVETYPYPGDERKFLMADLYTFELIGGRTFRYTSADVDIKANGFVYSCSGPVLKRSRIREVRGVEVDEMTIDIAATPEDKIAGVPWLSAIKTGLLDGARVTLERAFLLDWRYAPAGVLTRFAGRVAPSSAGRTRGQISVKSDLELLNIMWPRSMFQPGCRNTLYDGGCTLQKWAFASSSSVNSGSTRSAINTSLAQAAGFFDLGAMNLEAALSLPGTAGNYASTPDSAVLDIAGDLDVRLKVSATDWTPAANIGTLIGKSENGSSRSWKLELLSGGNAGKLNFQHTTDGTIGTAVNHFSTVAMSAADGAMKWVRVVLDVNNGAGGHTVTFYTSDDGVAWTALGAPVVTGGTIAVFVGTSALTIGGMPSDAQYHTGNVYYAEIRNGIDGPIVAKFDPTNDDLPTPTTVKSSTGETWTVNQSGGTPAALIGTANRGVTRSVKKHTSGVLTLALPLPNDPVVGDPFFAFPGCDKLKATCETKFNNKPNFRAEPYIPLPETAL